MSRSILPTSSQETKTAINNTILELMNVAKIGNIISIESSGIKVKLKGRRFVNNQYYDFPIISCNVLSNNNTKGFQQYYEVGDQVLVAFTDFYYSQEGESINDINGDLQDYHSINNGIILGIISKYNNNKKVESFIDDKKFSIDKNANSISMQNNNKKINITNNMIAIETVVAKFKIDSTDKFTIKNTTSSEKMILSLIQTILQLLQGFLTSHAQYNKASMEAIKTLLTASGGFINPNVLDPSVSSYDALAGQYSALIPQLILLLTNIESLYTE